ncbi:transcriptional regulator, AraC family protein [Pedobacter sp. BAL39]|uniref:AraC family transcriptional regulator n=1 Tax=Pedobacter sp. BAL39 TaxID=391596 RepID=UPI00015595A9|nr:helix-turn-helix domain-containing protein [Pedobacter sp. BAL39]EDM38559.1 transcriptional regulator, AraC family protein [Pedobacter sp. BAL39]
MKSDIPVYDIDTFEEYKNSGILVNRFGPYSRRHEHLHNAHRHSFYHLVFFTRGSGSQTIDFKKHPVVPGLIYFMSPGQVHSWSFEGPVDGYIVNFSEHYFKAFLSDPSYLEQFSFFDELSEDAVMVLPEACRATVSDLFEQILNEGQSPKPFAEDLVRLLMVNIFIQVARASEGTMHTQTHAYNQTLLKSFRKLIEHNFIKLKFPKQYAALLYVTPNHLNALCNDLVGTSAGELIRNRIILEAKRLLINMELSISEIAEKLAFNDDSYFIKFFKKQVGTTPDKFRKQQH